MRTILTHFFNEEFLLPRWLEHHKTMFDHGILIDYNSTDRSVEICREICPSWNVVTSTNQEFDSILVDREVVEYERKVIGWKVCLNVTEFLVGNLVEITPDTNVPTQHLVPSITFYDWDPTGHLDANKPLWHQKFRGIPYTKDFSARHARSIHNFDVEYKITGRHFYQMTCDDVAIFHYANAISSPEMLNRRLQIQTRVSERDRQFQRGWHHTNSGKGLTEQSLYEFNMSQDSKVEDCTELMRKFVDV